MDEPIDSHVWDNQRYSCEALHIYLEGYDIHTSYLGNEVAYGNPG